MCSSPVLPIFDQHYHFKSIIFFMNLVSIEQDVQTIFSSKFMLLENQLFDLKKYARQFHKTIRNAQNVMINGVVFFIVVVLK